MSDEVEQGTTSSQGSESSHDGASRSSVQPFISVQVPRNASREEILGAVDRALTTAELPFFSKGRAASPIGGGTLDAISADATSTASVPTAVAASAAAAPAGSSGPDNDLLILVQKEGG